MTNPTLCFKGMGATCYFMFRMVSGDHKDGAFQQRMMRGRVGAQAATVLAMCFSGMWAGHRAKQGGRKNGRRMSTLLCSPALQRILHAVWSVQG